jgi:hypothetical protein
MLGYAPRLAAHCSPTMAHRGTAHRGPRLWSVERRFGAGPSIAGKRLTLNGDSYRVVGVLPARSSFPARWTRRSPCPWSPQPTHGAMTVPCTSCGCSRAFSPARPSTGSVRHGRHHGALRDLYPNTNVKNTAPRVVSLQDEIVGSYRRILLALFFAWFW